ncbi:histidine kinase [Nonomuraea sp. NPDC026600]|uniref:sensor histidine kinase n=1 Tax=Nonomuraea sp. NPDC026600 TaxID=3155363 RepID=UPI0033C4E623
MALVDATPGERVISWMRSRVVAVDGAAALALAVVCEVVGLAVRADAGYLVVSPLLLGPLAVRRVRPEICLVVVSGVALVQWLTVGGSSGALPADVAVPIAVHAVAAYGRVWASRLGLAVTLLVAVLAGANLPMIPSPAWAHLLVGAFFASTGATAWAIGALQRVRRRQVEALAERARLLEIERDQRARLAVLAERTRIAREMHDVVAHSLAVVIAQADGGRYAGTPEAGTAALTAISDHARRALSETRRVLGVLRDGDATPGRPGTFGAPQPGVDDLPGLVEQIRAGGVTVNLTLDLPPGGVEPGLSLAAYRIVQEGLTNVMKYAGAGACTDVAVRWGSRLLEIDVLDDGCGPPAVSSGSGYSGYGVLGMRERVSAYGGTVTLAPRPGGGAALRARIPVSR